MTRRLATLEQHRILRALAHVKEQQDALARVEAQLIQEARADKISWHRIAEALGARRQVIFSRHAAPRPAQKDLHHPSLTNHSISATVLIDGPTATATITATDDSATYTYNARHRTWLESRPHCKSLPAEAREVLEALGALAQATAERRHAGIQKRLATIAQRNSAVGRPRVRP